MKLNFLLFFVLISFYWTLPNNNAQKSNKHSKKGITGIWQVKELHIGSEVSGSLAKMDTGMNLVIKDNMEYSLDEREQGVWKLVGNYNQIMFIKGKMEGLWQIESLKDKEMVISIVFDGHDRIKERMVRIHLNNYSEED